MKKSLLLSIMLTVFSLQTAYAKNINLYQEPKKDAHVIATIDSDKGIIPIYTPKEGEWIKVGDPVNGNVGWVNVVDMENNNGSFATQFRMTQHTINTSKGPRTFQVIQFGIPKVTQDQTDAMLKEFQIKQAAVQKSIQKMMNDMVMDMNMLYETHKNESAPKPHITPISH